MSDAYLKTAAKQFSQAVQPYELEVDHVTYDSGDKIEVTVIASPTLSNEERYTFDITKRNPEELAWGGDHDTFQLRIDLTAGSSTSPEVKSAILKAFKDVQHKNWNNDGQDWNDATKNNIIVETSKFVLDQFGIPDSDDLKTRYDTTKLTVSNENSVSDWPDETGNGFNLTSGVSPTYKTGIINNNPIVRFGGNGDYLDVAFSAVSQPFTIFYVAVYQGQSSSQTTIVSEDTATDDFRFGGEPDSSNDWRLFAGGSNVRGGNVTNGEPYVVSLLVDGGNSELRLNGSSEVSFSNPGSNPLNGLSLGGSSDVSEFDQVDVGELLLYPQDKSGIYSDVEQYLGNKWGISV